MDVPVVTFFNNKGGVGKTSLVYHLASMCAELGRNVVAADLDPQSNLTSMFLTDERLEILWPESGPRKSVYGALKPLIDGIGDITCPHLERAGERLSKSNLSTCKPHAMEYHHTCSDMLNYTPVH